MLRRERDHDVRILRPTRSRMRVGKTDTAIGQANVIDDAGNLLRRYLLADFVFRPVTQSSCFFNARSGWGTQVQRKLATIHRWKKVLPQPREQSEGEEAGREEAGNKNTGGSDKRFERTAE